MAGGMVKCPSCGAMMPAGGTCKSCGYSAKGGSKKAPPSKKPMPSKGKAPAKKGGGFPFQKKGS